MPVKERQIIESSRLQLSVTDEEAEKIMEEIMMNGTQIRQDGVGKEMCLTSFTHPIEKCSAWAVEVWTRGGGKWTRVYFTPKQADDYYDSEMVRINL